ncbi:nucleotidyltransferase domain-containing protein [Aquimarina sp. AU119]|uniref:nucleotidyltransferase domain-containing protein n=1 Tax=Aquimarina sp. AU119 TaxID=2108528 RepID=UPI000D68BB90|nr:nucleotidyltransferase domain-containing protein [Aquimarina sp. AU119]
MDINLIIEKFVQKWKSEKNVEGILLTGSYATGLQMKDSDIDFRIILNNNGQKFIKGVEIIEEKQISFLGSSIDDVYKMFDNQLYLFSKFQARIFCTGKILFDKSGKLELLKNEAKDIMSKPFRKLSETEIKMELYATCKLKDELLKNKGYQFDLNYYLFLNKIFLVYSKILKIEIIHPGCFKLDSYFFDSNFRNKYMINKFPDKNFISIYVNALKQKTTKEKRNSLKSLWDLLQKNNKTDFNNFLIVK